MVQSKRELEAWYHDIDPWKYRIDPEDAYRKKFYLAVLEDVGPRYSRVLDVGAGEGWITKDLPADEKHAIEYSDNASDRFPDSVKRLDTPEGTYDLVMTTGTLYAQYDHELIAKNVVSASSEGTHVFIGGIKDWLLPYDFGTKIRHFELPYREYTHVIDVYEFTHEVKWSWLK